MDVGAGDGAVLEGVQAHQCSEVPVGRVPHHGLCAAGQAGTGDLSRGDALGPFLDRFDAKDGEDRLGPGRLVAHVVVVEALRALDEGDGP